MSININIISIICQLLHISTQIITIIIIIRLINIVSRGSTNNVNLEINTYRPWGVRKSEVLTINLKGTIIAVPLYCNCMIIYSTTTTQNTYNDIISEQTQYKQQVGRYLYKCLYPLLYFNEINFLRKVWKTAYYNVLIHKYDGCT